MRYMFFLMRIFLICSGSIRDNAVVVFWKDERTLIIMIIIIIVITIIVAIPLIAIIIIIIYHYSYFGNNITSSLRRYPIMVYSPSIMLLCYYIIVLLHYCITVSRSRRACCESLVGTHCLCVCLRGRTLFLCLMRIPCRDTSPLCLLAWTNSFSLLAVNPL